MRALPLLLTVLVGCSPTPPAPRLPPAPAEAPRPPAQSEPAQAYLDARAAGRPLLLPLPERVYRCEPADEDGEVALRCGEFLLDYPGRPSLLKALGDGSLARRIARAELAAANPWQVDPLGVRLELGPDHTLRLQGVLVQASIDALPGGAFELSASAPPMAPLEGEVPTLDAAFSLIRGRLQQAEQEKTRAADEATLRKGLRPLMARLEHWKSSRSYGPLTLGAAPAPRLVQPPPALHPRDSKHFPSKPPGSSWLPFSLGEDLTIMQAWPGRQVVRRADLGDASWGAPGLLLREGKLIAVSEHFSLGRLLATDAVAPHGAWLAAELSDSLGFSLSQQVCDEDSCTLTFQDEDSRLVAALTPGFLQATLSVSLQETSALRQQASALLLTSDAR